MSLGLWVLIAVAIVTIYFGFQFYKKWKADKEVVDDEPAVQAAGATSAEPAPATITPDKKKAKLDKVWTKFFAGLGMLVAAGLVLWAVILFIGTWTSRMSKEEAQRFIASEINRRAKEKVPSPDTTFYVNVTQEWSEPLVTELDQCLHIKNMEPVAYEEMFDDGSTVFFPKVIEPFKTKVQILDRKGRVVETLTADKYGRFTIIGRRGRQLRVLGAESVVFQIRRTES